MLTEPARPGDLESLGVPLGVVLGFDGGLDRDIVLDDVKPAGFAPLGVPLGVVLGFDSGLDRDRLADAAELGGLGPLGVPLALSLGVAGGRPARLGLSAVWNCCTRSHQALK